MVEIEKRKPLENKAAEKPWNGIVIYEAFTPSFLDTNGDGIGDLEGVRQKLGYFQRLGVDALWLPPIFPTDLKDGGYDVKNFQDIDPRFGDLKKAKQFIDEAHEAGIKVIFDLVINHTSTEHEWFKESASSKDNPKRDWFTWQPPKPDGSLPNNWDANFGGPAWEFDKTTGEYYLHSFLPEQADLNWRNPEVMKAMKENMRFWFNMGVDALRLDSAGYVRKHKDFPEKPMDEPVNLNFKKGDHPASRLIHEYIYFQPEMRDVLRELVEVADEYPGQNKFVISESCPPPSLYKEWIRKVYDFADGRKHAPFNSQWIAAPRTVEATSELMSDFYANKREEDIAIWQLGSHDAKRLARKIGREQAGVAAMELLTTPGSPVILFGDELGIVGQEVPRELKQDKTFIRFDPDTNRSRDDGRLPMAWDARPNAGFTSGKPWMPIPEDYKEHNVESELADPDSFLHYYMKLIEHRRNSPACREGEYKDINTGNKAVRAYTLIRGKEQKLVVANYTGERQQIHLPYEHAAPVLQWPPDKDQPDSDLRDFTVKPNGAIVFSLTAKV